MTIPGLQTFIGEVHCIFTEDYPKTVHVHVNLKPEDYAWVTDIPDPMAPEQEYPAMSLLKEFTVSPPGHDHG